MALNKETLRYALEENWPTEVRKGELENGRVLGFIEANLIELGVLNISEKFPYLEGENYERMILRLAKENI